MSFLNFNISYLNKKANIGEDFLRPEIKGDTKDNRTSLKNVFYGWK
jgi:hypothetical protein